jgi:hypothetical protein
MSVPMRRVIQTLTPTEEFIRAVHRAGSIREATRARADADYVERIQDAEKQFLKPAVPEAARSEVPEQA